MHHATSTAFLTMQLTHDKAGEHTSFELVDYRPLGASMHFLLNFEGIKAGTLDACMKESAIDDESQLRAEEPLERFRRVVHSVFATIRFKIHDGEACLWKNLDLQDDENSFRREHFRSAHIPVKQTVHILNKAVDARTKQDIRQINLFSRRIPQLRKLPAALRSEVAKHLQLKQFEKGRVLIRKGHPALSFNYIIEGELYADTAEGERTVLDTSDTFGGNALLFKEQKRCATVTTKEASIILAIDRIDFLKAVFCVHVRQRNEKRQLLRGVFGESSPPFFIDRMIDTPMARQTFLPGQFIVTQDTPITNLLMVSDGTCEVWRTLSTSVCRQQDPLCVSIKTLSSNSILGEAYVLSRAKEHIYTATASTRVECYILTFPDGDYLLSGEMRRYFRRKVPRLPTDSAIMNRYVQGLEWKNYTQTLARNVQHDKAVKRGHVGKPGRYIDEAIPSPSALALRLQRDFAPEHAVEPPLPMENLFNPSSKEHVTDLTCTKKKPEPPELPSTVRLIRRRQLAEQLAAKRPEMSLGNAWTRPATATQSNVAHQLALADVETGSSADIHGLDDTIRNKNKTATGSPLNSRSRKAKDSSSSRGVSHPRPILKQRKIDPGLALSPKRERPTRFVRRQSMTPSMALAMAKAKSRARKPEVALVEENSAKAIIKVLDLVERQLKV